MNASKNLLLILVLALLLSSCIDEYESDLPDPNAFRIASMIVTDSAGKESYCSFDYHSLENRLYSMRIYTRDSVNDTNSSLPYKITELESTDIQYPESPYPEYYINVVRSIDREDDMFYYDEVKKDIVITGDLRTKETESTYVDDTVRITEYIYDDHNRLIESLHYKDSQFKRKEIRKIYIYLDGNINLVVSYKRNNLHEWVEDEKTEFTFLGDKLADYTVLKKHLEEWIETRKIVYTYTGSHVASISTYINNTSDAWSIYETEGFAYDPQGYLVADSIQRGTYSYKRKMKYKKGEGNFRQIFTNPIDDLFKKPHIR